MRRRELLRCALAAPILFVTGHDAWSAQKSAGDGDVDALRKGWRELAEPGYQPPKASDVVEHSAAEWRALLDPAAFAVLREQGTERAFTSPLNDEKRPG